MLPLHCVAKALILIGSFSWPEFGSSSRLGSLWVEPSFSGPSVEVLPWRGWVELGRSSADCGLCSMVSCRGLVVSWITRFIWMEGCGLTLVLLEFLRVPSYHESYLLGCNVPDRNTINFQDPVPNVHGKKRVAAEDSRVQPVRQFKV